MEKEFSTLRKLSAGIKIWGWATLVLILPIAFYALCNTPDDKQRIYIIVEIIGGGIGTVILLFSFGELILVFLQIEVNTRKESGNTEPDDGKLWCCPKCTAMNNNKTFKCTSCGYSLK